MNPTKHGGFERLSALAIFVGMLNLNHREMKENQLRTGYVMVSRGLLLDMFEKHGEADSEEEAFLRVLVYVNYRDTTVTFQTGRSLTCRRGESVISFSHWEKILCWSHGRVSRFFRECFKNGIIGRMDDGCASHICIPNYDAWVGNSGRGCSNKTQRVESEPGSPLTEDAERVSGNVAKDPAKKNDLHRFMEHYSEVTQTPMVNIGRAERYWKQLSTKERTKAFEGIDDYYFNLSDIRYCMQAATYLRDKAFLNRYDY